MREDFQVLVKRVIGEVNHLRDMAERASGGRRAGLPTDLLETLSGDLTDLLAQGERLQQIRDLNMETIRVQEEERKRIAREIHDGPAQSFASFVRQIEMCEKILSDESDPSRHRLVLVELEELKTQMRQGLHEMRKLLFDLRPPALEHLGLGPALRQYVQKVCEEKTLTGTVNFPEDLPRLSMPVQITVFRIVQEAVTNIFKHANANNFRVNLHAAERELNVEVEDDGIGMARSVDKFKLLEEHRFGLISMQERAELVTGSVRYERSSLGGLAVRIQIPLSK